MIAPVLSLHCVNSSFNLKTTYARDVEECKEGYSDDVEPDRNPATNLKKMTDYSAKKGPIIHNMNSFPNLVKRL